MATPFKTDPIAPPLTDVETRAAVPVLVDVYPKTIRSNIDPPIHGQQVANISLMLFDGVKNGVSGFLKVRGVWPDVDNATAKASSIIREVDSLNMVHLIPVGHWVPITERKEFTKDTIDVGSEQDVIQLNDEATKKKQAEDARKIREIREAEERVKDEKTDPNYDKNGIDYYTMKRVTQKEVTTRVKQVEDQLRMMKKSLDEVSKEIHSLNKKHPTYRDLWVDHYNEARRKSGIAEYKEEDDE
uniref:Uncharacterized protein n=1 Tax=viral metagenome TaxID=1070528 RepID=A0A6C0LXY0_9ZZZZ